jgi:endopeptidase La
MNPNNPDINDFINAINNKRKRGINTINQEYITLELRILSLEKLEDMFKSKKLTNRETSMFLNNLEYSLKALKVSIKDSDREFDNINKAFFLSILTIHIEEVVDIRKASNKKCNKDDNQFNILDYIKNKRDKLASKLEKKINDGTPNKRVKKDEYESDSDDILTDSDDEEYKPDEEYRPDEEYKPNQEYKPDNKNNTKEKKNNTQFTPKMGRDFINQLYQGKKVNNLEEESIKYFSLMSHKDRETTLDNLKEINNYENKDKPVVFQIMELDLPVVQKNHLFKNYMTVASSRYDNNKLKQWVDSAMQIPFGKFKGINLNSIKTEKVKEFLNDLQKSMDNAAYGHDEAKRQIIQMMGQQIRNPKAKGNILGLWGPPGNGKTSLIKNGIAPAMDKPFVFISLGGASDSSFLEGHSYTYEGSVCGRIVNGLMAAKCMDPVIYFDELDKISKTPKGDEITNILIHLTDPVQNTLFRDKYFHGLDIDLSKATFIFSFNDPCNVNHILLDRITCIETKYLLISQKIHISKNYLLPTMFKEMGFIENAVNFSDEVLREIVNKYTREGGIRKLKSLLYNIVRELNISNLLQTKLNDREVKFPFTIKLDDIKTIFKNRREIKPDKINVYPKCGIVNGLWANHLGNGGVLPIEVVWVPTEKSMHVKATGNLEKVIKESTDVATSVAWNYLDEDVKQKFMDLWKNSPMGFHIHCPDGSTPKDGPSAGGALTLAIYSLLTHRKIKNNVAMTGEINLQGRISAIGGLEEKLEGAKKTGVVIALVPKENQYDLTKIMDRNPSLLDDKFKVIFIENFGDIVKHALLPCSLTDTPFLKMYYGNDNFDELII